MKEPWNIASHARLMQMPFGHHQGEPIASLPDAYLTEILATVSFNSLWLKAVLQAEASRRGILVDTGSTPMVASPEKEEKE